MVSADVNATNLMPAYLYFTSISLYTSCPTVKCLTEFKSVIKQFKLIHINAFGLFYKYSVYAYRIYAQNAKMQYMLKYS